MEANPSSWRRRIPICLLSLFGAAVSGYLALYQFGLIGHVWDPVFGRQSEAVLHSWVSAFLRHWLFLPDAALGTIAYLADFVLALAGSSNRWRTQPWLVAIFGFNVLAMAGAGVVLVAMQATTIGAWCLLCLLSACLSIVLLYLSVDEVWAMAKRLASLWRRTRDGDVVWHAFWGRRGGGRMSPFPPLDVSGGS